jgi:hypothetical protein
MSIAGSSLLGAYTGKQDNPPLLWPGPRRVVSLFLFHVLLARRVARHRTSSVIRRQPLFLLKLFTKKLVIGVSVGLLAGVLTLWALSWRRADVFGRYDEHSVIIA